MNELELSLSVYGSFSSSIITGAGAGFETGTICSCLGVKKEDLAIKARQKRINARQAQFNQDNEKWEMNQLLISGIILLLFS